MKRLNVLVSISMVLFLLLLFNLERTSATLVEVESYGKALMVYTVEDPENFDMYISSDHQYTWVEAGYDVYVFPPPDFDDDSGEPISEISASTTHSYSLSSASTSTDILYTEADATADESQREAYSYSQSYYVMEFTLESETEVGIKYDFLYDIRADSASVDATADTTALAIAIGNITAYENIVNPYPLYLYYDESFELIDFGDMWQTAGMNVIQEGEPMPEEQPVPQFEVTHNFPAGNHALKFEVNAGANVNYGAIPPEVEASGNVKKDIKTSQGDTLDIGFKATTEVGGTPTSITMEVEPVPIHTIPFTPSKPNLLFLLDFEVENVDPGTNTATITFYLTSPLPPGHSWYKYINGQWIDLVAAGVATINPLRNMVTLTIENDSEYDENHTDPGVIADDSGPGSLHYPVPILSEWGMIIVVLMLCGLIWVQRKKTIYTIRRES
ncbi:MAG: choice-of-anchor U domain-containing protein [bacterium]